MEIMLTERARVSSIRDGNWTLEESRPTEDEHTHEVKWSWRIIGHYGRLDQAVDRALDVCVFDRSIERITVVALAKRLAEARAALMAAVQAIDPVSLEAARAGRTCPPKTLDSIKKRDANMATRVLSRGKGGKR